MRIGNLAVHLAAVAVPWLGLTGLTVEAKTISLELNSAIAPEPTVRLTPDDNLVPSEQVTFSPLSQEQIFSLTADSVLLTENSNVLPRVPPTSSDVPLPSTGISQRASDLLPMAASPSQLIAQTEAPPSPVEAATATADTATATDRLVKAAQNPIANLISVPFQSNWNFGVGPENGTQYILNVQPVIPIPLGMDWLVVARWIAPVVVQPELGPGIGSVSGLGDMNPSFFLVPKNTGEITWGIGPTFILPTATSDFTGQGKWSAGPTGVIVWTADKWVVGALVNQLWSFAGDSDRKSVSQFLLQPFLNYNLPNGWYLTSSPIITANWMANSGNQWTVPLGGGIGKLFKLGNRPVNASLQAYGYVVQPEDGPSWLLRFQIQLLFPTGGG